MREREFHGSLNQCTAYTLPTKARADDQANYAPDWKVIKSLNSAEAV